MSKNVSKALNKEGDFSCLLTYAMIKSKMIKEGLHATTNIWNTKK